MNIIATTYYIFRDKNDYYHFVIVSIKNDYLLCYLSRFVH